MRKVVVSEFISLDGVIEEPMWTFQFGSPEQDAFKFAELRDADALLLGRVTYEGFAAAWPGMAAETGEYGAWMNGYPKYVASTTLEGAEWNATVIKGDLAGEVNRLKGQEGKDILVFGSGKLVEALMRLDLVDEYRLLVYPIVLGRGQKLFAEGAATTLRLVKSEIFSSGVAALTYQTAPKAETGQG
jgi:dihydrofolate reductase